MPGWAVWTNSQGWSAINASMNVSVMPTDTLKLFQRPGVRLAVMNSMTSGWSTRNTPIWAPRRAPALSTVEQDWSNTLI